MSSKDSSEGLFGRAGGVVKGHGNTLEETDGVFMEGGGHGAVEREGIRVELMGQVIHERRTFLIIFQNGRNANLSEVGTEDPLCDGSRLVLRGQRLEYIVNTAVFDNHVHIQVIV